jgi:hypothetical protein
MLKSKAGYKNYLSYSYHTKAGNTAIFQAGDISRRKEVKEKRPSPFLFSQPIIQEIHHMSEIIRF